MNTTFRKALFMGWVLLMAWGLYGVVLRFTHGLHMGAFGSYVSWGLWVAAKIFFVGICIGCSLYAFAVCFFGVREHMALVRPSLLAGLAAISAGLVVILFDLGHMERLVEVMYRPHAGSLLALATWATPAYLGIIVYAIGTMGRGRAGNNRVLGALGLVVGVILSLFINGGELSTLISSPHWHSPAGPILHFSQTLTAGIALVALLGTRVSDQVRVQVSRIFLVLLLFGLLLEFSSLMVEMWNSSLAGTQTKWAYLVLGLVLPIGLIFMAPANKVMVGMASLLVIALNFWARYEHVVSGQTTEPLPGLAAAFADDRLTFAYAPNGFEYAIVAFSVALAVAIYVVAHRLLPKSVETDR